jgi:hypothetical protein
MKLNEILFEGAKTPEQAVQVGLGLYISKTSEELIFILFSPKRCNEVITSYQQRHKGTLGKTEKESTKQSELSDPSNFPPHVIGTSTSRRVNSTIPPWKTKEEHEEYLRQQALQEAVDPKHAMLNWLAIQLGNRAVIGSVTATWKNTEERDDLWKVDTSSAVQKYGPLIYEMVMGSIYPEYLRSDYSLTPASRKVWNVMITREDVQRSWVGEWGPAELVTSWAVSDMSRQLNLLDILTKIEEEEPMTEKAFNSNFVRILDANNMQKLGPFYAYRRKSNVPAKLIEAGNSAIQDLADSFKVSENDIKTVLENASGIQFERLYNKNRRTT